MHYDRNASMFSVHCKILYQSTKGWLCPDRSRCNNVLISVETDFDPGNEISVSLLFAFGSKTSNFSFSGFFNRIFDLNTRSCDFFLMISGGKTNYVCSDYTVHLSRLVRTYEFRIFRTNDLLAPKCRRQNLRLQTLKKCFARVILL